MDNRKIELEYVLNTSPKVLYNRLSTPGGLAEWFAEDVNLKGKVFTFVWNDAVQKAEILQKKDQKYIRLRWLEDKEDYFEFLLRQHDLTGDLSLIVTDFADEEERDSTIELWNCQIADLKRVLGL